MRLRPPGYLLRPSTLSNACWRCSQQLSYGNSQLTRTFAHAAPVAPKQQSRLKAGYFLSNKILPRPHDDGLNPQSFAASTAPDEASKATTTSQVNQHLPHRRRQAAKRHAANIPGSAPPTDAETPLPQDASSALTTESTKHPANSFRRQLSLLLSLSKPRLTILVVLTAMAPYALYPVPAFLSPSIGLDTPSLSPLTLTFLTTGTALCSASANALNMLYEPAWDAKMTRTRNRPLVRGLLSERKALVFAVLAAVAGVGSLYFGVNPTVAFLGAANIALYAGVYTPMKRVSWLNTWVGAVVGGIPPLMGWAAAAGESATGDGSFRELLFTTDAIGGWLLAALLFAWQFPHFMALSWPIREEYKAAGHKMLCWINPARNGRVALRYSLLFFPLSIGLCAVGVTEWSFAATSLPVNFWLAREAVRFWQQEGFKGSARGLFWASVWHLPVIMVLALVQKKGMWGRVWRSIVGEPDLEDEDEYEDWVVDQISQEAEAADGEAQKAVPPIRSE
ncbi:mitochondria protoheme IX farnesyltransferase [Daldinia decipiens]|uniref:mitochondria protoheme IX farnesyltransferase n=1 Tax=Daldinia decipiens TaxID=326647 RepID=UPI0020C515FF|nr:mitochondria protoheme IX farnesyltransferase [Daldinia decipiens]KAI1652560.1 mitochondria protoheme IX farnesyltransferase [Daldinia decipiens]